MVSEFGRLNHRNSVAHRDNNPAEIHGTLQAARSVNHFQSGFVKPVPMLAALWPFFTGILSAGV